MPEENKLMIKYKSIDGTKTIAVKDTDNLLNSFTQKVIKHYESSSIRTDSDISDWKSNHDAEVYDIKNHSEDYDAAVGKLLGIEGYCATQQFAALLKYQFDQNGKFEGRDNPHELTLYQLQNKWYESLPLLSFSADKGKILQSHINFSIIAKNIIGWYEFQDDMNKAEELLVLRTIYYQQQLCTEQFNSLGKSRLDLRPNKHNSFMTIVWNMFHLPVEIKQDDGKETNFLEKYLSTENVISVHDFICDYVISWGGAKFPQIGNKKINLSIINPASYRKSFESRAAKNNRVIDMINWLSCLTVESDDNKKLRDTLLKFLLHLQSNTENVCIKDAIGFATLGISSMLTGLYDKGKLVKDWAGGRLGKDPDSEDVKRAYNDFVHDKRNPVGDDLMKYYLTGLSLIFGSNIQAISSSTIETTLALALKGSKE